MIGPDIKQLKENFDKFAEETQNEVPMAESLHGTAAFASTAMGMKVAARLAAADKKKKSLEASLVDAKYWLYGQHSGRRSDHMAIVRRAGNKSKHGRAHRQSVRPGKLTSLRAWNNGSATGTSMALFIGPRPPKLPHVEYLRSQRGRGGSLAFGGTKQKDLAVLRMIRDDMERAKKGMAGGGGGLPTTALAKRYFNEDVEDMMELVGGDQKTAWKSIFYKARDFSNWLAKFIKIVSAKYSEQLGIYRKNSDELAAASRELSVMTNAMKEAGKSFTEEARLGASSDEAMDAAAKAAVAVISAHDKKTKSRDKPAPEKAAPVAPAPVAPSRPIKIDKEKYTFEENTKRTLSEVRAPTQETHFPTASNWKGAVRRDYIDKLQDINSQVYAEFEEGRTDGPAYQHMKEIVAFLGSLKGAICAKAKVENSDKQTFVDGCKFITKEYAVARGQAVEAKNVGKATLKNKSTEKKAKAQKGTRSGGRSRRKERCGKAPRGEYGSRRFRPSPRYLGTSKARAEKYPEAKKAFDQFYADLKEFGVRVTEDYKWGSKHNTAYRKILCKLDEKSAKPKEDAGAVNYKLANKYNANRQRLGLSILTGDQLKQDYLNNLIRGGMHMGLTHEESDQLMGGRKKKGAEPVKKKETKPKSLSGQEAIQAYEHAQKIYQMAKGFTGKDSEYKIMMIVEKHLSEGTIGILFNMYSRVLRQNDAADRGDLVRELYHEDLTALAKKVRVALQRQTRGAEFREGKVYPSKNKIVYAGRSMDLNKLIEHISKGAIKNYKDLKYQIRKKAIMESKNNRAVQSTTIANVWITNWLKENIGK